MKKFFIALAIIPLCTFGIYQQTYAASNLAQFGDALGAENANILTGCAGREDGIMCVLELVVDILTIGIGILGVIGISVVGIQYLTAGGNEEQTRKAKRRMFEIILGLAAYAVIYALLKWLGVQPN